MNDLGDVQKMICFEIKWLGPLSPKGMQIIKFRSPAEMETLDESTSSKRSGSPRSEFSKRHKKRVKIVDEVRNVFTFFMAVRCF